MKAVGIVALSAALLSGCEKKVEPPLRDYPFDGLYREGTKQGCSALPFTQQAQ